MPRGLADPDLLIDTSDTPTDSDFAAKLSELEHVFKDPLAPCVGDHACCGLVEDQILSIVRVAFVRTRVRMSTAFAVSIFLLVRQYAALDVKRVAAPDAQPLLAEVDAAAREVRSFWDRESNITKAVNKAFNKAANDNEKRPSKTDSQIRICNFATGILNGNSRQEPKQYHIQTNLRQYLDMSPMACGLVVAWFNIRQNWASLLSIDQRQTVLFLLHFYTAAKQGKDLEETWEDMEYLIEAHGSVKLFHGDRPKTYEESISQLRLSFGMALNLSMMYEGRGATKKSTKQSNGPKISDAFTQGTMPILQLLSRRRPQYDIPENEKTGLQDIELALSGINSNNPNVVRLTPEGRLANRPELFKLYDRTARRTPVEFLEALQKQIELELRDLAFDYGALERRCWELLDGMRAATKKAGFKIEDYNKDKSKPLSDRHLYQLTEYIAGLPLVEFADTNTGLGLQQRMDSDTGFAEVQKYKQKYLTLVARMADFIKKRGDTGVREMREADD